MDVKNAFLQRDLKEDVFMCPLAGLIYKSTSTACKLHYSLYSLK